MCIEHTHTKTYRELRVARAIQFFGAINRRRRFESRAERRTLERID